MAKPTGNIYEEVCGHFLVARLSVRGIFERSVVWIYRFSEKDGASGLILNRPLGKTLASCSPVFAGTAEGSVPMFDGGPVDKQRLCFVVRSFSDFRVHHSVRVGATLEDVHDRIFNPGVRVYGFVGRAEWSSGQLENELSAGAWIRVRMDANAWNAGGSEDFWRSMVAKLRRRPEAALMLRAPENLDDN